MFPHVMRDSSGNHASESMSEDKTEISDKQSTTMTRRTSQGKSRLSGIKSTVMKFTPDQLYNPLTTLRL